MFFFLFLFFDIVVCLFVVFLLFGGSGYKGAQAGGGGGADAGIAVLQVSEDAGQGCPCIRGSGPDTPRHGSERHDLVWRAAQAEAAPWPAGSMAREESKKKKKKAK